MSRSMKMALLASYVAGLLTLSLGSCALGPKLKVEISDPDKGGVQWYDQKTGKSGFSPYSDTVNHVCFNPVDFNTLLDYCAVGPKK